MRNNSNKTFNFILSLVLAVSMAIASFVAVPSVKVEAAPLTTLTLKQAKALAVANSRAIEKLDVKISVKQAALSSAIKSISVKQKNMKTFRWSPLIKFKFPTNPNLEEAYEFQYKPIQIQYDIDKLKHSKTDQVLAEYETVNNLYVEIYVLEKSVEFNNKRLEILETTIEKNKAKIDAVQADIDAMEKEFKKLTKSVSNDTKKIITNKKKLSNKIGVDVTNGFKFVNPFASAELTRDKLPELIEYTLDRDNGYYEVCLDETAAKVSVETSYRLMKSHYSRKYINMISSYVDAALNGVSFSGKAFYDNYKEFVGRVNEKWNGKKRILFFKFPKNWFQGEIDGDRYIQDDPYKLYSATMDYTDARLARDNAKAELEQKVEDTFDAYIDVKNSYNSFKEDVEKAEEGVEKARILNKEGTLTYAEYKEKTDTYEELQNSLFDSMKQYSQTLYSFDRLTCGGITKLLGDLNATLSGAEGGDSFAVYEEGASYYIRPIVKDTQFQVGVSFPENFEVEITDYELWVDNNQVGTRMPVADAIRHFAFDLDSVDRAFIRFYNGDEFVDDCDIDPTVYSGPLYIFSGYDDEVGDVLGTYSTTMDEGSGRYTMEFAMRPSLNIASYRVTDSKGKYLLGEDLRPIDNPFVHLESVSSSIDTLTFEFYDAGGGLLFKATADTQNQEIIKTEEEE